MNVLGIPIPNPSQGKQPDSIRGFLKVSIRLRQDHDLSSSYTHT